MSTTTIFLLAASFCQAADAPPRDAVRCPRDIKQDEYAGWPMRNPVRQMFRVNQTFTWLREPLLRRLPDKRIVLFHNPSVKDFTDTRSHHHAFRTPLEMWVSSDGMQSWYLKRTLVSAPQIILLEELA